MDLHHCRSSINFNKNFNLKKALNEVFNIRFSCPHCENKEKPSFIGKKEVFYFELFLYECKKCRYSGFLGEFVKHEPSVADFHIDYYHSLRVV